MYLLLINKDTTYVPTCMYGWVSMAQYFANQMRKVVLAYFYAMCTQVCAPISTNLSTHSTKSYTNFFAHLILCK